MQDRSDEELDRRDEELLLISITETSDDLFMYIEESFDAPELVEFLGLSTCEIIEAFEEEILSKRELFAARLKELDDDF